MRTIQPPAAFKPYPWQDRCADALTARGALACAADPGAGKTQGALLALSRLPEPAPGRAGVLIIAPPGRVCAQWVRHAGVWSSMPVVQVGGKGHGGRGLGETLRAALAHGWVVILPWSRLARAEDSEHVLTACAQAPGHALILDESHRAQSAEETQTGRTVVGWYDRHKRARRRGLLLSFRHVLALSGTPSTSDPRKLRVQLLAARVDSIEHEKTLGNKYDYERRWWGGRMQFSRAAGRELWTTEDVPAPGHGILVRDSVLRVPPEELAQQLPPFRRELCADFAAGPKTPVVADRALATWADALGQGGGKIPSFADLADLRREGTMRRAPGIAAWVKSWNGEAAPDRLLLVLTCYQESVGHLVAAINRVLDCPIGGLHGGMPDAARRAVLAHALAGKVRVLVATHGTIGTGVDGLQHVADAGLFAEIPWTPGEAEQSEGRLLRTGQPRPVRFVWVTSGIEGRIAAVVGRTARGLAGILADAQAGDW